MTTLTARFTVDGWDERPVEGLTGDWLDTVEMRKTFTSGLVGTSVALFVSSGEVDGYRSYFAAEHITAALVQGGEQGNVTVHHGGLESAPERWFGHVVPNTGSGPFAGWAGTARIVHDEEGAYFSFEVS
ncbi:MAG TPA: DUF3224 domain-containing protein [Propionibacteriaceae bacterium]|nr:DUF3224 domain-containing protein [Propionibacteriaceae bacterium]